MSKNTETQTEQVTSNIETKTDRRRKRLYPALATIAAIGTGVAGFGIGEHVAKSEDLKVVAVEIGTLNQGDVHNDSIDEVVENTAKDLARENHIDYSEVNGVGNAENKAFVPDAQSGMNIPVELLVDGNGHYSVDIPTNSPPK